ncbi:MAG: hypothetical protein AB2690_16930, partial [Candidatus Thiodiazotropha endolucinida]
LSEFRQFILETSQVECHVDLGSRVLDATVEVACNVFTKKKPTNQTIPFFRFLLSRDKNSLLVSSIDSISQGNISDSVFIVSQNQLSILQGNPFVYWIQNSVADKLSSFESIEPEKANIRVGLQTGSDFRFLRIWWEVPTDTIVSPNDKADSESIRDICLNRVSEDISWCFYSKIDKASPFVAPIHLLVNWSFNGREIKAYHEMNGDSPSRYVRSESSYFLPGICYMLRSSRLIPYIVPRGIIPTAGRSQIYPINGLENDVLAIISSNVASAVARFKGENFGQPKFQNSMVSSIPFAELSDESKELILKGIQEKFDEYLQLYENSEAEIQFKGTLEQVESQNKKLDRTSLIGRTSEVLVGNAYQLSENELSELELDMMESINSPKWMSGSNEPEESDNTETLYTILSWSVGVAMGRFDIRTMTDERIIDSSDDPYRPLPAQSPGMLPADKSPYCIHSGILVVEEGHKLDLPGLVYSVLEDIDYETDFTFPIRKWIRKDFFQLHLKQYSKSRRQAPIYWPLQTPSGSYTLWVYYHRLTEQTLYTCVNDFVEPKLKSVTEDLNTLRSKSARSSQEEKELARLTDLEAELKDFRDELLRIAKFWKPNLNDGVQITASPIWKLFQHKPWQKKLKQTWEKLEKGDYDWAHLACSIWPERVLSKCHQDRSLAIAHDVEDIFWHEVEVPIVRRGRDTGDTKLEWQPKDLTDTELTELVNQTIAGMK